MRFPLLVFILMALVGLPVFAQQLEWAAGIDGFLDNREYYSIDQPQSMLGSRAKVEVGASLDQTHRLMFGIDYLYEFGQRPGSHSPGITLYYQYYSEHTDFRIGAFPRTPLLDYPLALLSDTLRYYRPNMEGAYLGFRGDWGRQQFFIDWTSLKTSQDYEKFIFGFSGRLQKGSFFLDHHFLMGHFADRGITDQDLHIRDNGGFFLNMGTALTNVAFLDSLTFSLGTMVSLDRIRGVDDGWQTPAGFLSMFSARYRWLGIHGLYYGGKGHTFLYGDPFYRLKQYGRVDLFYAPFEKGAVQLKFVVGFHFTADQVDYSQQILLSMNLNGSKLIRKR